MRRKGEFSCTPGQLTEFGPFGRVAELRGMEVLAAMAAQRWKTMTRSRLAH